jgi:drug/metabolite transporter (DMT)-like permease
MGALFIALSSLGYATNPIFGKVAYEAGATPITLGAIRFTFATAGLWLMLLARGPLPILPLRKRLQLVGMGALGFGMVALLYFTALQHIDASLATGLFYNYPAMVTLVAIVRGEGVSRPALAGLALAALGTWLLLGTDLAGFTWQGASLILAGAVLYSAYIIVSDRWSKGVPPLVLSAHVTAGAAALYLLAAVLGRQPLPGTGAYLAGAGLALCSTIFALTIFFAGIGRVGPGRAAIISTLEPAFTALLAVLLLGERLSFPQVAGIGLVVLGAAAAQMRDREAMTTQEM